MGLSVVFYRPRATLFEFVSDRYQERETVSFKTLITWVGAALFTLLVVAIISGRGWYWAFCGSSPLTFSEIDIDHNGKISFIEADYKCNSGTRQINQEGQQCTEYFAYKDGLPLKIVCSGN
jgi:hypothetical protein